MNLSSALRLHPSEVVALVGGGGKTSTMFRLAAEVVAGGGQVITTTTTRIFAAQIALAPVHFVAGEATLTEIAAALERTGHVLLTGPVERAAGKALGIPLALVPELQALPGHPTLLVEADGSRMRPFKAPAEHEPVIPPETTLVVPVAGLDILARTLSDEFVHRAGRVAELTGAALGDVITPELVAAVLAHPLGGLKDAPPAARRMGLINKVESLDDVDGGRQIARLALRSGRFSAIVLAKVRREPPVVEVWGKVAAVVLAAGQASRMGQLKQVMPWGPGGTIIGEVVQRLQRVTDLSEIVVVTGSKREEVERRVAEAAAAWQPLTEQATAEQETAEQGTATPRGPRPPVRTVFNPKFAQAEMARSVQAGLDALPEDALAALVVLGDQPQVRPDVIAALLQRWRETQAPVVAPFHQGQRGNPILLDRAVWPLVRALPDSANPREIFQAVGRMERVDRQDDTILRDLDTPEDYAREFQHMSRGIINGHEL
jgi:molybdenum cofactor cytidylyltransferase